MAMDSSVHQSVEEWFSRGRFADARRQLDADCQRATGTIPLNLRVSEAELLLELGHLAQARRLGDQIIRSDCKDKVLHARLHRLLARCSFHAGDITNSRKHFATARQFCEVGRDHAELARVELTRFSLFLGIEPLQNEALLFPGLRRLVAHSAHPHLMVELRLCVARCEARRDSLVEAKK